MEGPREVEAENSLFSAALEALESNVPAVCLLGRGGTRGCPWPVSRVSEEWSVCVLSRVIKEKKIFHWVLSEGFYFASVLW